MFRSEDNVEKFVPSCNLHGNSKPTNAFTQWTLTIPSILFSYCVDITSGNSWSVLYFTWLFNCYWLLYTRLFYFMLTPQWASTEMKEYRNVSHSFPTRWGWGTGVQISRNQWFISGLNTSSQICVSKIFLCSVSALFL